MIKNLLLAVFGVLLLGIFSCTGPHFENGNKTVFRYNESAGITSLDPAFARDQANIWVCNQLFNGLVQLDENLKVQPCIAKNWKVSDDGLIYTFNLRNDVRYHNSDIFLTGKGRNVIASDFEYSLKRILDPKVASPGAWVLASVKNNNNQPSILAINDTTLQIILSNPFPSFLSLLSMQYCSVVPHEGIEKFGSDFRKHPVGSGPFFFKLWKEGVKLVLLKNNHYFEKSTEGPLPYLDAVSISFIVDKQSAFLEFIKGNLDFISGIDASYKDEVLTRNGTLKSKYAQSINLTKHPYLNTEYFGFMVGNENSNLSGNPLKNKLIRQAINYSFDRVKMIKYLRNNIGQPGTNGIIPLGTPFVDNAKIKGYNYNPEKAKLLLKQAGYPEGKGLPEITLTTNPSYLDLCKYIQSQLNEAGIKIKIDVTPPATLRELIAQSKAQFFRASWIADYPDAENYLSLFYTQNYCPAGPNYTHYSSSKFDQMFRECALQTNDSLRGLLYEKMDQLMMEDAPVVVLFYDEVLRFTRKNITNLGANSLNILQLKQVKKYNYEKTKP